MSKLKPWLSEGLKFTCTACGKCCRGSRTNVWVNATEVKALASKLEMEPFKFVQQYCEDRETEEGELLTSLKNKDGACILLDDDGKTCRAYDSKPMQCETYPFWASNVVGPAEWSAEATRCEGIDASAHGEDCNHTLNDISLRLILGQVHDRGVGQDWSFSEASEYLRDASTEDPEMISAFSTEFFSSHRSHIVYESTSDDLRIVDTTTPAGHSDGQSATTRRLEFISSASMSQTVVALLSSGEGVDHSALQMPVHRQMAVLFHAALASSCTNDSASQLHSYRLAVVGAGGCALPSHLLHVYRQTDSKYLHVDAVDPNQAVLTLARRYFGAVFTEGAHETHGSSAKSGMRAVEKDGVTYLRELVRYSNDRARAAGDNDRLLDMIIVDAFSMEKLTLGAKAGTKETTFLAPPPAFVHTDGLSTMLRALRSDGVLVMNILGPVEWKEAVKLLMTEYKTEEGTRFLSPVVYDVPGVNSSNQILVTCKAGEQAQRRLRNLEDILNEQG